MRPRLGKAVMLIRRLPSEFWPGRRMRPRPTTQNFGRAPRRAADSIDAKRRLSDASPHLDDGMRDPSICADRSEPRTRDRRLARFISGDVPLAGP
jgi:hypothetical protein